MVGTTNAGMSSSILYVNITDSGSSYVADKTLAEIYKAYQEKKYVVVRHGEELLAPYSIEAMEARFFFTSGNVYAEFTITNSGSGDVITLTVLNLTASNIGYDNATSGMTADNLQTAVDELAASRTLQAVTDGGAATNNVISFTNDTDSTSTTTGAVVVTGGLGVAKAIRANQVYGAVWNDYAEFRRASMSFKPGSVMCEDEDGVLHVSCKRLQKNPHIVSDTYGFAIGETKEAKCPVALCGRVLAVPDSNRARFRVGDAVCAGIGGTVSRMRWYEKVLFPDRILGVVSEIPTGEVWEDTGIGINGRIWINIK